MSSKEKESFISGAVSRGPGKRQVRPTSALFESDLLLDEDEEDEDFIAKYDDSSEGSTSSGEDEESREDAAGSDGENKEEEESSTSSEGELEGDANLPSTSHQASSSAAQVKPVCAVCLNLRCERDAELIECDRCTLTVHDQCYGVEESEGRSESSDSSSSTEPWFCEPCLFGLTQPPYCELCPSRFGAFKRADVGGGWVHLLCALYTHGLSFADVDHLSGVSWQEVDYGMFGRKACDGCSDPLEARTGIVTQCEAALCQHHYHISCAMKLGLLSSLHDAESGGAGTSHPHGSTSDAKPSRSQHTVHMSNLNFLLCKKHSNSEEIRVKRVAYASFYRQEERRMAAYKLRSQQTPRQELRREQQLQAFKERMRSLEGVNITLPKEKKPRMLHTSPQFLSAFAKKAELAGMGRNEFNERFMEIPSHHLPIGLPPAFTPTFARYYQYRDGTLLPEETRRLAELKKERESLLHRQKDLEVVVKEMQARAVKIHGSCILDDVFTDVLLGRLQAVLGKLSTPQGKLKASSMVASPTGQLKATSVNQRINGQRASPSIRGVEKEASPIPPSTSPTSSRTMRRPNILKRRGPLPKAPQSPPRSSSPTRKRVASSSRSEQKAGSPLNVKLPVGAALTNGMVPLHHHLSVRVCSVCKETRDQHLTIFCGTCQKYYHLRCLDPPLKRMPILRRAETFECSNCYCPSTSDDNATDSEEELKKQIKEEEASGSSIASRRKLVRRSIISAIPLSPATTS